MTDTAQPQTVKEYLAALKAALAGAAPALIRDALSDAEEHLRNEIAQNPGLSEAEVLASVIETYGTPEEIAEEYRTMEEALAGPFPKAEPEEEERRRTGFFGIVADPRAYGGLIYMFLSLATGIFYFTWVTTGLSLSLGFMILIIGIPFALLFIGSVRVLALVEGRVVEGLLGVRMPRRLPPQHAGEETVWVRVKAALADIRTWSSMFYMLLMLPLGVIYFTLATTLLALSVGAAGGAIWSLTTGESRIRIPEWPVMEHFLTTAPGLILLAIAGILLVFVTLHVARAVGAIHARIAEVLLVRI